MSSTPPFRKVYEKVSAERNFTVLAPYRKGEVWATMAEKDRELLALLLVSQGEQQLADGDSEVTETFALAGRIAPASVAVWLRQGRVFATQRNNIRCLDLACEALKKVTELDPSCFDGWFSWATVLLRIAIFHNDARYFRLAEQKFTEVFERFAKEESDEGIPCEFYWKWGLCWFYHGKHSGEAMDFRTAIARFQRGADKGLNKAVFWNDFGNALVDLGCLIGRQELLYDASQLYHKASEECRDYFPAWLNLACCYQELFVVSGAEDFFQLADETFRVAAGLEEKDVSLWLKWGMLYVTSGRLSRDVRRLQAGVEKFAQADKCEPHHALVLERWTEGLILLGSVTESLQLLKEGEEKILSALALTPDSSNAWYIYGLCLNEQGHYFGDDEYFLNAIDKFQYGAACYPHEYRFFYGMALSYSYIGELRCDPYMVEKALESFAHAARLYDGHDPQFWNDWGASLMRMTELTGSERPLRDAITKFEYAIGMQGGDRDTTAVDPQLLYNYGCALDFLGDYSDDEQHYRQAVQVLSQVVILDPDYVHARYNLGLAWSHLGELTSSVDAFQNAIQQFHATIVSDAEDEMAWNDWGLALLNLARLLDEPSTQEDSQSSYREAESKFLHAVGLGSLQAYYNLACLYALVGNGDAAMYYLERAYSCGALPPLDDLLNDEWLDSLRDNPAFRAFLNEVSNRIQDGR